jgi:hypothetical protein
VRQIIPKLIALRDICDRDIMFSIYYALVQSLLNYGILSWGSADDVVIYPLESVQRCVLKIILKKHRMYPTVDLFIDANVLDIRQLYAKVAVINLMKHPRDLSKLAHTKFTRQINKFTLPKVNTAKSQRQCWYVGIKLLNELYKHSMISCDEKFSVRNIIYLIKSLGAENVRKIMFEIEK